MKLHNTLTRKIEDVSPLTDNTIRMYSCGPTVYDHAHLGNLSAYIFADTLHRAFTATGYPVKHVMNYTDVDDKTIRRSRERYPDKEPQEALHTLTNHYIDVFLEDMRNIGNDIGSIQFIRATDSKTIIGMQELITALHKQGFAYVADDGVYFSIEAYRKSGKTYGQLLEISASNTSEARIQNDEYDKDSVHDFALWKKQKEGEPSWPFSVDGKDLAGRPGWHIECSVMSRQALGQPFDVHTGGVDLIFPHHENEIAQSTALEENPVMAQFFAHNEHILVDGKKMSKSLGNFYTLEDIVTKDYDPLAFRLLVLQAHYRNQVNFTWESLEASQNRLRSFYALADLLWQPSGIPGQDTDVYTSALGEMKQHLSQDIATPLALARLSGFADEHHILSVADQDAFKGFLDSLDGMFGLGMSGRPDITNEQKQIIADRQKARGSKDWKASDILRDQLKEQGLGVRDTEHGPIWYRA